MDGKENGSDGNEEGEVHAGVQARGGAAGQDGAEHRGDGEDSRARGADAAQLDPCREQQGRLGGAGSKPVSAEQMEIARLRAELARVKMEPDILGKATAYFASSNGNGSPPSSGRPREGSVKGAGKRGQGQIAKSVKYSCNSSPPMDSAGRRG